VLKKEGKGLGQGKNRSQDLKKKTRAEFLESKKKTLTDSGKGSWILVPVLLPRLFLLVFPITHERRRLLYKRTLKFNKDNVTVTLLLPWNSRENHNARCELYRGAMISLAGGILC